MVQHGCQVDCFYGNNVYSTSHKICTLLCFVVIISLVLSGFMRFICTHILQDYFIRLPQYQWSNHEEYVYNWIFQIHSRIHWSANYELEDNVSPSVWNHFPGPGAHPTKDISIKFDQNLDCSSLKCALPITTKFCTCHNSVTVVTCAKFCCDL